MRLIDLGIFSSVLCQYNLLDRANEEALAYAKSKGLGTVVMGPVGGGKLAGLPRETAERLGIRVQSSAELALRFVFANPNVDCALSGMSSIEQVEENAVTASKLAPLSAEVERMPNVVPSLHEVDGSVARRSTLAVRQPHSIDSWGSGLYAKSLLG